MDQRARRTDRLRHARAAGAIRRPTRSVPPSRGIRCSSPAAASRAATTAWRSRRRTSSTTRRGRPTARCTASGVADDNVVLMTEEDFTTPCDQGGRIVAADITSSLGGEGETNSTPAASLPDDGAQLVPPQAQRVRARRRRTTTARRTTSSTGRRARGGVVRPGASADRRDGCSRPAPGGLLLRDRHGRGTNPTSLSWDTAWHGNYVFLFDMAAGSRSCASRAGTARVASLRTAREPRCAAGAATRSQRARSAA